MRQVIHRRFSRALKEDADRQSGNWPDLLLIDGGVGQLSAVHEALDDLGLMDLNVVAISKGPDRHAGREQFHIRGRASFTLAPDSAAMHFLQRLRDESHRYAIGTHRAKRTNPNSPIHWTRFRALGQSAKRHFWRILARRARFLPLGLAI